MNMPLFKLVQATRLAQPNLMLQMCLKQSPQAMEKQEKILKKLKRKSKHWKLHLKNHKR